MILDRHWWRSPDGRLVPDGEAPDGSTLAYPGGVEIPDHLAEQLGLAAAVRRHEQPESQQKQAPKLADKMVAKPADKAAPKRPPASGTGSGVEAWRDYVHQVTGEPLVELAKLSRDELIGLTADADR